MRRSLVSLTRRGAGAVALCLACGLAFVWTLASVWHYSRQTAEQLDSASDRLEAMTDYGRVEGAPDAAILWAYGERLRLGLESPFRLIEAAAGDPRMSVHARQTASWALLARLVRGGSLDVDPAALDELGPSRSGHSVSGEQHLRLIEGVIRTAENPRAAELGIRFAYTLASAERLVAGIAPLLAAEAAALTADHEIARREASALLRGLRAGDPVDAIRERRREREFYVERPALLAPVADLERDAVGIAGAVVDSLRAMRPAPGSVARVEEPATEFAASLLASRRQLPVAPMIVTVQRYLPLVRAHAREIDVRALARARDGEMLVAATHAPEINRPQRRVVARMLLAAGVAMRSVAQAPVWLRTDSAASPQVVARALGLADISFDRDVPRAWQPYFLHSLMSAVGDLQRVFPELPVADVHIRFRMTAPADSALAMHDPRTRTVHLPVLTAGGTLAHELAHDLDRRTAIRRGIPGYQSDAAAVAPARRSGGDRLAASLRALAEDLSLSSRSSRAGKDRAAEVFATRVDWLVASALAHAGITSGFLTGVQDELFTGHVVHPDRLRPGSSRNLLTALQGMTVLAPEAARETGPSAQTILNWSLSAAPGRRSIGRGNGRTTAEFPLPSCAPRDARERLVWMAADGKARGIVRQRAQAISERARPAWAHAVLGEAPWSPADGELRVANVRAAILGSYAKDGILRGGLSSSVARLAADASCAALVSE